MLKNADAVSLSLSLSLSCLPSSPMQRNVVVHSCRQSKNTHQTSSSEQTVARENVHTMLPFPLFVHVKNNVKCLP